MSAAAANENFVGTWQTKEGFRRCTFHDRQVPAAEHGPVLPAQVRGIFILLDRVYMAAAHGQLDGYTAGPGADIPADIFRVRIHEAKDRHPDHLFGHGDFPAYKLRVRDTGQGAPAQGDPVRNEYGERRERHSGRFSRGTGCDPFIRVGKPFSDPYPGIAQTCLCDGAADRGRRLFPAGQEKGPPAFHQGADDIAVTSVGGPQGKGRHVKSQGRAEGRQAGNARQTQDLPLFSLYDIGPVQQGGKLPGARIKADIPAEKNHCFFVIPVLQDLQDLLCTVSGNRFFSFRQVFQVLLKPGGSYDKIRFFNGPQRLQGHVLFMAAACSDQCYSHGSLPSVLLYPFRFRTDAG